MRKPFSSGPGDAQGLLIFGGNLDASPTLNFTLAILNGAGFSLKACYFRVEFLYANEIEFYFKWLLIGNGLSLRARLSVSG